MTYRAVLFDLGGVVLESPFPVLRAWEEKAGLPAGALPRMIAGAGEHGAWSRLERGELPLPSFYEVFEGEAALAGVTLRARELMEEIHGAMRTPRPGMLEAIERLRAQGLKTAAITNNWRIEDAVEEPGPLAPYFDVFIESWREGMRKPDPRIFQLACERVDVRPDEAVFLDDIGQNLKAARAFGLATIKVGEVDAALRELERMLDVRLT